MLVLWYIDRKDKGSYLCTLSSLVLGIHPGHICYLTISSSATPFSFCLRSSLRSSCLLHFPLWSSIFEPPLSPFALVHSSEPGLHIRWLKYWRFSFSISLSNEHSGLISFQIDWFDLLAVQGTLKSLLQHQLESINSSALNLCYGPTLRSIHDYCN